MSDAKEWLIKLQREDGKSYSTLHTIRGVLRPAFQMAVDDDIIRKNPFDFLLANVVVNDSVTREALTRKEERAFLDFIKSDKHYSKYYDGMYILFKTGMRISEFVGLTVKDIDLENRTINIDHQLQRTGSKVYKGAYFSCATAAFAIFAKSVDFTGFFKGIKTSLCQIYATKNKCQTRYSKQKSYERLIPCE